MRLRAGGNEFENKRFDALAEQFFCLEFGIFFLGAGWIGRIVRVRIIVCIIGLRKRFNR